MCRCDSYLTEYWLIVHNTTFLIIKLWLRIIQNMLWQVCIWETG